MGRALILNFARTITGVLFVTAFAAVIASAQAGRKAPNRPVATPEPTPIATPAATTRPNPDFKLTVVSDISASMRMVVPRPERIHEWAFGRLRQSPLLDTRDGGYANRRDAINLAKGGSDTYVVLIQLRDPGFGPPDISSTNRDEVWIDLTIFSPGTGKTKFSRSISTSRRATGPLGTTGTPIKCYPGIFGNEYHLLLASLNTAEAVMDSFNVPHPPYCR